PIVAPRPRLPILVLERFIRRSVAHCLTNPPSVPTVDDCQPDADDGARAPTANPEQTSDARSVPDLAGELPPLQHDLLERQSVSLATKNVTPFVYHDRDTQLQVYAVPEDGMATIGASDVLIWTAGHSLAAQDYRPSTTRSFGFTPYELPV